MNNPEHQDQIITSFGFVCPLCHGNEFGSAEVAGGELERICHSPGCGFQWLSFEDWRYFRQRIDRIFGTQKSYEHAYRAHAQSLGPLVAEQGKKP